MRAKSDGFFRLTKVGLWFLVFLVVIVIAASNTGNNGLFLVLAVMVGIFLASHFLAGRNVRRLSVALAARDEIFARRPAHLDVEIRNRGLLPRWLLMMTLDPRDIEPCSEPSRRRSAPFLVPYLEPGKKLGGPTEVRFHRRGRRRIRRAHITSLFPLGFFRKGRKLPVDLEILVYPEILATSSYPPEKVGPSGERPSRRTGWGHELLGLRTYRPGDDPRAIHWKQSARTGELILKERETEENRRLLLVLDNAVGELSAEDAERFERMVSEAATAALDYLERGFEVALLSREGLIPFAAGPRQRRNILEALALIEGRGEAGVPLVAPAGASYLHLSMDAAQAVA